MIAEKVNARARHLDDIPAKMHVFSRGKRALCVLVGNYARSSASVYEPRQEVARQRDRETAETVSASQHWIAGAPKRAEESEKEEGRYIGEFRA